MGHHGRSARVGRKSTKIAATRVRPSQHGASCASRPNLFLTRVVGEYLYCPGRRILQRLRTLGPFLEGSLTVSTKRCGRPTCRWATEGPVHETALLTWKEDGTTRTLHVPIALRAAVAAWVAEAKRLKQLSHAMSVAQRAFLIAQRRQRAP